jgi:hypothetical protein
MKDLKKIPQTNINFQKRGAKEYLPHWMEIHMHEITALWNFNTLEPSGQSGELLEI